MKNGLTLLYVEDDKVVRDNLEEIFKAYFDRVLTTDNGNKAIELYEANDIDVAILDISILGINGLKVAAKIRETNQSTVILMLSAYSDKDKLLEAINLNLIGYLVKPVKHKELKATLEKIVAKVKNNNIITLSNNYLFNRKSGVMSNFDKVTTLTKSEKKIIQILIDNKHSFMSSLDIHAILFYEEIETDMSSNSVTQLISRLNKKVAMAFDSHEYFIENCYGAGYKINFN